MVSADAPAGCLRCGYQAGKHSSILLTCRIFIKSDLDTLVRRIPIALFKLVSVDKCSGNITVLGQHTAFVLGCQPNIGKANALQVCHHLLVVATHKVTGAVFHRHPQSVAQKLYPIGSGDTSQIAVNIMKIRSFCPGIAFICPHSRQRMGLVVEHQKFQGLVPGRILYHLLILHSLVHKFLDTGRFLDILIVTGKAHTYFHHLTGCAITDDSSPVRGKFAAAHPVVKCHLDGKDRNTVTQAQVIDGLGKDQITHGSV